MIDKNILKRVLKAREVKEEKRNLLTEKYSLPLITLSLNIPGPEKYLPFYEPVFQEGWNNIIEKIKVQEIVYKEKEKTILGYCGYLIVNKDSDKLKVLALEIEKNHPLGQLFDIDVSDGKGKRLSREKFSSSPRLCVVCNNKSAIICIRERNHTLEETLESVHKLIDRVLNRES